MAKEKKKSNVKKEEKQFVTVNCNRLNVRINPDINSARVRQESKGAKLEMLGTAGNGKWIKVPGGYVMAEYVS